MLTACAFEDDLREHNALYYQGENNTRRPAWAGAYMSLIDFPAMEKMLEGYPDDKIDWLEEYYQSQEYLSPGFSLIRIGIKYYKRKKHGTDESKPTGGNVSGEGQ